MLILEKKDVVARLRAEVQKAGTVAGWSRSVSLNRTDVSNAIHQNRPISKTMVRALGLRTAVVDGAARVLTESDILELLRAEVAAGGGQSAWARKNRMSRPALNKVLRKERLPSANIVRALGLRFVITSD
jgi:DNA-binding phage protein